ncbi:hypothetical protein LCGC14_2234570 [marine sediment metagenome]|uniref:Uncharacterized protein n=1 Tax=marine sediment metagenome TaxID=412755 RepID=A0A0F9D7F9_9ZZZZ
MSYSGEADEMLYKQDREDKRREMLERRARMGGPDVEDCENCGGEGFLLSQATWNSPVLKHDCPGRCLGTGVQP